MELNIINLFNAMPGACAQGLIWGIMAIGVYITYKIPVSSWRSAGTGPGQTP